MRFDDTLQTVLASDISTPFGKASAWRQLIDLIGRRRVPADERALVLLNTIRADVPQAVRAASARALALANPPFALVELCASDDTAVASPVLASAALTLGEWVELLPRLSPAGRAVLRGRRDLPNGVAQALESFAADFAITGAVGEAAPHQAIADTAMPTSDELQAVDWAAVVHARPLAGPSADDAVVQGPIATEPAPNAAELAPGAPLAQPDAASATSTFVSFSAAALTIPVVAAALKRGTDVPADRSSKSTEPSASPAPAAGPADENDGRFEIADVVARIDAFYTRQQGRSAAPVQPVRADAFRFETDAHGVVRWIDGVSRAPLIGLSLEMSGTIAGTAVDNAVAGAFRQRTTFSDGRLVVAGASDAAGDWRISGTPAFDPVTGRFAGYRGTARRPRAEDDAARVPAPAASADSLRQLMHELRTPANAIAGFAEMIERQMLGDVAPVYRERAGVIRDHARALLAAIEDLDIAARIEASALQLKAADVALRPVLVRIADDLATLAEMRGASIVLMDGDAVAAVDARAVERLLSRLLATLLSAAGQGERIEVDMRAGEGLVLLGVTRPQALLAYSDDALFAIDDEHDDAALLGTGFALRLLRNLARELSGALVIEPEALTLQLPATVTKSLEVMR